MAIACAAVRGAFESLVFALIPFVCFIFAVEFPAAVGLARVPQRVQPRQHPGSTAGHALDGQAKAAQPKVKGKAKARPKKPDKA